MAQRKFKTGDRVYFAGGTYTGEDTGTVIPDNACASELFDGEVYVKWDSDGEILKTDEYKITHDVVVNPLGLQLTVENCIEFLSSQGYTVTLSKN